MARARRTDVQVDRAVQLGRILRIEREGQGVSRERLAQQAQLSSETIRKIEAGVTHAPDLFTFAAIAYALGLSIDELVRRAGNYETRAPRS